MSLPLVALYLYLDEWGCTVPPHPSVRTASPVRYLECALVQAASLRLRGAPCEVALISNIQAPARLGHRASRIWRALRALDVEIRHSDLRVERSGGLPARRILRDAILTATEAASAEREVWLPNLDCVWVRPELALAAAPGQHEIGCLAIPYPPDWRVGGPPEIGDTREALGRTAASIGRSGGSPPWVGADLLVGRPVPLKELLEACDRLDAGFAAEGLAATNEQLLSLAGALGQIRFQDLSAVARRIQTGARHGASPPPDAAALGLWHLPAEKGLSLRRASTAILRGRTAGLGGDLADPERARRRFNVGGTPPARRLRDDGWVAAQRVLARLRPRSPRPAQP